MKSNNYTQKIFSGAKYFLLVPLIITLVSVILFTIFSFNTSTDFKNNYTFTVSYKADITNKTYDACENIIKNNIYDKLGNSVSVSTQKLNEDIEIATSVKVYTNKDVKTDLEAVVDVIKSEINTKIGDGHIQIDDIALAKGQNYSAQLLWTGVALMVVMAVMFAYLWFRYELKTAITSLTIAPFITVMYTALYILFRLPVSTLFVIPLIASVLIGYIVFVIFTHTTRADLLNEKYAKCTNAEILQDSIEKIKKSVLGITILTTFMYFITLLFFTKKSVVFAVSGLIGLVLALYVSIIISSILWSKMYRRDKDTRLKEEKDKEDKKKKEGNKKKTKNEEDKILV